MSEACNWITFHAHTTQIVESKEHHPDFFGVFVCPASRRDPEDLLGEILSNRKLFLTKISDRRSVAQTADWGMNERLKVQVEEQGYGFSLTKIHQVIVPVD
jgi:hypothetical protein